MDSFIFIYLLFVQRLMTMETLQDKVINEVSEMKLGIDKSNQDLATRLSEFILSNTDISTEQTRMMENFATDIASIEQRCSGQAADLDKFLVSSSSVLDRLDRWSTDWQVVASQKLDRLQQQTSYDHDTIVKGQKMLESLVVEGIEKCNVGGGRMVRRTTARTTTRTTTTTTSTTTVATSTRREEVTLGLDDEYEEEGGCGDVDEDGIVRVGVRKMNDHGRDYNTRLCDQQTSGGGWTVGSLSSVSSVVLSLSLASSLLLYS